MTIFTDAGYTKRTVFKATEQAYFEKGTLLILMDDDNSCFPYFSNKEQERHCEYLPNFLTGTQDLKVVSLDGVKDGLLDEDGNLLFHTNKEWKKHKKALKQSSIVVTESTSDIVSEDKVESTQLEVGSRVKVVAHNNTKHWFDLDEVDVFGTIMHLCDSDMYNDGYVVKLDEYIGIYDGYFIFRDKHLELIKAEKAPIVDSQVKVATKTQEIRTEEDYRKMCPDTMIEVVIDGHKAEVPLADILILKHVVGKCNGNYLNEIYSLLQNFDGDMGGLNLDVIDISKKTDSYLKRYFNR